MADISPALQRHFRSKKEATRLLDKYLSVDASGRPRYTGSMFDQSALGEKDPNRITPTDLVAVSMLSIRMPARVSAELLTKPFASISSDLLVAIGPDRNLWSVPPGAIADDSPADRLWHELRSIAGIDWVTAGKLMARKRPKLIPVFDSVVRDALQPGKGQYWSALREALQDEGSRKRIQDVQRRVPGARRLSLLRIIDIVVWMHNLGDSQVDD